MKIYPVVHVHEGDVLREVDKARRHDVSGVFLIDHDVDDERLLRATAAVTTEHPDLFVGVNFIGRPLGLALSVLRQTFGDDLPVQAVWADFVDFHAPAHAVEFAGLHFGGVAFKHQAPVLLADLPALGAAARDHVDVATTSGTRTGAAADPARLRALRDGLAGRPVALASGVTPGNVADYLGLVDHVLVASGIAGADGIDAHRLARLIAEAG